MAKLKLTKRQEESLYILRLEGLRREIELHEATEAYEKAKEIEKSVHQYVIDNNEYYVSEMESETRGPKNGDRITDSFEDFLMAEDVLINDYLPKVKEAYMSLYGIDNPVNFVYSHPMHERKMKAEESYMMIAVEFLKISGRPESKTLESAVKQYMSPALKKRLLDINKAFISGDKLVTA